MLDNNEKDIKTEAQSRIEELNRKAQRILSEKNVKIEEELPKDIDKSLEDKILSLEETLLSKGLISKDQYQVALKQQRENEGKLNLGETLVQLGFITETALGEIVTESSGIKVFDFKSAALDADLIRRIPKNIAIKYKILPISLEGEKLYVAVKDVYDIVAYDQIHRYFPKNIKIIPEYANEQQISDIIDQYYEYEMSVEGILKEIESTDVNKISNDTDNYLNPTVRLVDAVLFDAIKKGASDIHFEPEDNFVRLRYRIDGKLVQILTFHKNYWPSIVVRIKILSNMNIADTRNPQDGRISFAVIGRNVDFRVSAQPTVHGENIVTRILDKKKSLVTLEQLGLSEHNSDLLKLLLKRPEGVIILTGPTGCGKTTTLYSILSYINSIDVNIMTLEDPVEYQLSMIRQSGVKEGTGMNFADGIRSMMRQDPDIIFVGEVRDSDTAAMTIRAAMTGHQVFTTLHTNDSFGAIPRLVDLGVKSSLLSGSIICVIAQRLARKLCVHCKVEYYPNENECKVLGVDHKSPPKLYKASSCEKCNFLGYKGRIGICEILSIDRELDDMISRDATRKEMMTYAIASGFKSMAMDGIHKVLKGVTDLEELIGTIDLTDRMR